MLNPSRPRKAAKAGNVGRWNGEERTVDKGGGEGGGGRGEGLAAAEGAEGKGHDGAEQREEREISGRRCVC